jgi:hypothetical protein
MEQSSLKIARRTVAALGFVLSVALAACSSRPTPAADDNGVAEAVAQTVASASREVVKQAEPSSAAAALAQESCGHCEERLCRDYLGLNIDLVAGCYHDPDAAKVAACSAAVECGREKKCGLTMRGAEECYCGSASTENCANGLGIDGVCKAQFEAAAGTTDYKRITLGFGDRKLALGNAVFMLRCDRELCKDACAK